MSVRLGYILNFLEKGRTLYTSDRKYVEDLISKYLPSEFKSEVIEEQNKSSFKQTGF